MARKNNKVVRMEDYKSEKIELNIGILIFLVLLIYMIAMVVMYLNSKHIVSYQVVKGSLSIPTVYEGIAFREETTVPCNGNGYINFFARENEHMACGDLIYTLDSSGKIADMLETQEADVLLSEDDLEEIRGQIINFQHQFKPDEYQDFYLFKNTIDMSALKLSNYNMLNNMTSMENNGGNLNFVYAPMSGAISYEIDGYEGIEPEQVTKDMFQKKNYESVSLKSNQLVSTEDIAYKICTDENWCIVIQVDELRARELQDLEYVKVKFLKNQFESWAKVTAMLTEQGSFAKLEFTNSMITFASDRYIDIEIQSDNPEGLKVPLSALAKQEFFLIDQKYKSEGGNGKSGFLKESVNEEGNPITEFVDAKIYYSDDDYYYVDSTQFKTGDYVCLPNSGEKMMIDKKGALVGVYNINKGYADFTAITILYSNEEYAIIKSNTTYGLTEYDYIALDATAVNADDFVYE